MFYKMPLFIMSKILARFYKNVKPVVFFNLKIMGVAYHNLLLTKFWTRSSILCNILHFFIPHFSFQQHNTFFFTPIFIRLFSLFQTITKPSTSTPFQDSHMNFQTIIWWFASPILLVPFTIVTITLLNMFVFLNFCTQ